MTIERSLEGRNALVTGAAAGIGLALCQALAARGAYVVGADRNPEIETILTSQGVTGGRGAICDVRNEEQVAEAVALAARDDRLDILICNAGIFPLGAHIEKLADADWDLSLAVNLTGTMRFMRRAIPLLRKGKQPQIVVIGSRNVKAPGPGAAAYSAAKAGLTQLARVAALELAPDGIRVNVVHPDAVFDTALWTAAALERSAERYGMSVEEYKRRNLMKTIIGASDVADAVCALLGPAFAKTTGAQIPVDGGNDRVI